MKSRASLYVFALLLIAILGLGVACSKAPNDAQISSEIQNKFNQDSGLQGKSLNVQTDKGTVTLSGSVNNEAERSAAARYASSEPGVKQVVNNLQVTPATPPPTEAEAQPPVEQPKPSPAPQRASKPRHSSAPARHTVSSSDDMSGPGSAAPMSASNNMTSTPPAPTTPPPPPPPQKVTIPSGTTVAVRLVDGLDSATAQPGQTFHATLDSPLSYEGDVVVPSGYDVEGHVVDVKSSGKFTGQSLLVLQLDRLSVGGKYYAVQTDQYRRQGASRTKNTAEKVGAGAAIGAIIGGIAGGGKGAGIGAAAGGGLGGGVQAATHGQEIKLPSETVLNFTLQGPVTVLPTTRGPNDNRQKLDINQ